MGMPSQIVRIIIEANNRKKFAGKGLFIGRQSTYLTETMVTKLFLEEKLHVNKNKPFKIDNSTRGSQGKDWVSDSSLLSNFCDMDFVASDVTDYEGAEIVMDLNEPLRADLRERFDFIYNGSCLDNLFNTSNAIQGITQMLNAEGTIVHLEHGTDCNSPYLKFTPGWIFDYYLINRFNRVQVFIAYFNKWDGDWDLFEWNPVIDFDQKKLDWHFQPLKGMDYFLIAIAEKGGGSTSSVAPMQEHYRTEKDKQIYNALALDNYDRLCSEKIEWNKDEFHQSVNYADVVKVYSLLARCLDPKLVWKIRKWLGRQQPMPKIPANTKFRRSLCGVSL